MKPAIEINKLGKKFRIRKSESYLALRDTISDFIRTGFRKTTTNQEDFWALQDISLQVKAGERVGIIGKNGAGKSTLLKILSRITPPTTGTVSLRGRLSSLLEVGTGFHPELTGRENIYFNGSILGMKKWEITRQFDAIVAFSGVEKFLDTALKHYSSGMQLRLAFAVAAHLEPEILLIDEVLAVGDLEFQKKCIGKMEEVSREKGRTILFVSHNLQAVKTFCTRAVLLNDGKIALVDTTENTIAEYLKRENSSEPVKYTAPASKASGAVFIRQAILRNSDREPANQFSNGEEIFIEATVEKRSADSSILFRIAIQSAGDHRIVLDQQIIKFPVTHSILESIIRIPTALLAPNDYAITLALIKPGVGILDNLQNILPFTIDKLNTRFENIDYDYGYLNQPFDWDIETITPADI